ncbi:MAG: hypothetical protein ABI873_19475 [Marmoricola sp.]
MGYSTDFIGHIDIAPALNDAEIGYLSAFRLSRRFDRPGGPYDVPGNPFAEGDDSFDTDRYNRTAPGQPQLWCQWEVCWDGCCLAYDGGEKFYAPIPWLRYLVDHFLKPGAVAARSGDDRFKDFTFDHRLDGMVVGCRRDNKELFAISVSANRIRQRVLRPADPRYADWAPLPYELAKDVEEEMRPRTRRRGRKATLVAISGDDAS